MPVEMPVLLRPDRLLTTSAGTNVVRPDTTTTALPTYAFFALTTRGTADEEKLAAIRASEEILFRHRFQRLAHEWHRRTDAMSVTVDVFEHPSYVRLMQESQSPYFLKLALEDYRDHGGHWYEPLEQITNASFPDRRGRLSNVRSAWLRWGKRNGLI